MDDLATMAGCSGCLLYFVSIIGSLSLTGLVIWALLKYVGVL